MPELAAYDDEEACIADWRHAVSRTAIGRRLLLFALVIALAVIAAVIANEALVQYLPPLRGWLGGIVGGVLGGVFPVTSVWIFRNDVRRRLHDKLLERGIRTCVKCGYDLRGQIELRCPECGAAFTPSGDNAATHTK